MYNVPFDVKSCLTFTYNTKYVGMVKNIFQPYLGTDVSAR